MKTNSMLGRGLRRSLSAGPTVAALALCHLCVPLHAEIPAPDNILYGSISLDGRPVTNNSPTVIVEARRALTNAPVATGVVGAANLYTLRIPIEAMAPLADARSSLPGDTLFIVVRDATGVRGQTTYQVPEPGHVARIDFGTAVIDSDGDGLPDAWELAMFGHLGFNGIADPDGDRSSNMNEYLAGTHPANSNDVFRVAVALDTPGTRISFLAREAAGAGYEGQVRRYSLESATNVSLGPWRPVDNYTNIPAANQTVTYTVPTLSPQPAFYRGQVFLYSQ